MTYSTSIGRGAKSLIFRKINTAINILSSSKGRPNSIANFDGRPWPDWPSGSATAYRKPLRTCDWLICSVYFNARPVADLGEGSLREKRTVLHNVQPQGHIRPATSRRVVRDFQQESGYLRCGTDIKSAVWGATLIS